IRAHGTTDELLRDTNRTVIQTGRLQPETISRIEQVLEECEGKGIDEVQAPRQRLEQLFLEIVERARQEQVQTSGAVEGGGTAAFLRAEEAEGEQLIESLVREEPTERRATEVEEARSVAAEAEEDVLGELLREEEKPAAPRPRAVEAAPRKPKPSDVDESVIDSLLEEDGSESGGR
ncbi:MAG: hypothetical protein ACYTJ0_08885, partial [Planctomycetota bacterium]